MSAHYLAQCALALSLLVPALALLRARQATASAVTMVLTALVLLLGVGWHATGHQAAEATWYVVALLLGPLAVVLYPVARWRHPVDLVVIVAVVSGGALSWVAPAAVDTTVLVLLTGIPVYVWWELGRASARERRALTWMSLGVGSSTLLAGLLSFAAEGVSWSVTPEVLFCVVGPAMYVGAARPDLADARALVVPVVTYLTAAVAYLALFTGVASALEEVGGEAPTGPLLALVATVLAATFHPMQVLFRGVVEDLLFGVRPDPLDAAGLVSGRIGEDPVVALRAIREALALPYAALRVDDEVTASSGARATATVVRALPSLDGQVLELEIGLRAGDLGLSVVERQVLDIASPLLAQTLRASALAADLQLSRQQTITAREEERRRMRRDLHDGLGPRLTGIAFTADAARNRAGADPEATERLLETLREETSAAIDSIRELVYAMRPPALDELGLAGAVTQAAGAMRSRSGQPLEADLRVAGVDHLPAAIEVAAYRIVVEGLANVVRHTDCEHATVSLTLDAGLLTIEVSDRATGSAAWRPGVGLSSMKERAEELGGTLVAGGTAEGGRVRAELPVTTASGQASSR